MKKSYYFDTNIWLNIFKKEIDQKTGLKFWKVARDFIEKIEENEDKIIVSTIVIKELFYIMGERLRFADEFFRKSEFIEIIKSNNSDYLLAREWEKTDQKLSFYDYLHLAIAKRLNLIFITRDKGLLEFAENKIEAYKPEELLF